MCKVGGRSKGYKVGCVLSTDRKDAIHENAMERLFEWSKSLKGLDQNEKEPVKKRFPLEAGREAEADIRISLRDRSVFLELDTTNQAWKNIIKYPYWMENTGEKKEVVLMHALCRVADKSDVSVKNEERLAKWTGKKFGEMVPKFRYELIPLQYRQETSKDEVISQVADKIKQRIQSLLSQVR
jgi:hypothetical protein